MHRHGGAYDHLSRPRDLDVPPQYPDPPPTRIPLSEDEFPQIMLAIHDAERERVRSRIPTWRKVVGRIAAISLVGALTWAAAIVALGT